MCLLDKIKAYKSGDYSFTAAFKCTDIVLSKLHINTFWLTVSDVMTAEICCFCILCTTGLNEKLGLKF